MDGQCHYHGSTVSSGCGMLWQQWPQQKMQAATRPSSHWAAALQLCEQPHGLMHACATQGMHSVALCCIAPSAHAA